MSDNELSSRFESVRARLRQTQDNKEEKEKKRNVRSLSGEPQAQTGAISQIALEDTEPYLILVDSSLDPKEKIERIAALLTFNADDLEQNTQRVNENRAIVSQLLSDFTLHNKESIELVRDNPLSKLRSGIKEVFEEYHALVSDRSDLKSKLELIDELTEQKGGPQGLVDAMLTAKDKEVEKNSLEQELRTATAAVEAIDSDIKRLNAEITVLGEHIETAQADPFLFIKFEKKKVLKQWNEEKLKREVDLNEKVQQLDEAKAKLIGKTDAYQNFVNTDDWRINEKILEILDIGNEEFIDRVKALSDLTLSYIDNTEETLTGVRDQLDLLLQRVTGVHTLTNNTKENVAIILDSQRQAQMQNAQALNMFED